MHLRKALATIAVAVTAMSVVGPAGGAAAATPADLFISEYVEGAGNNKALEFFNGTGAPIDLAAGQYVLQIYFNGATTATTIPPTGKVAAGDVYVFAASAASAPILAQADQTYGGCCSTATTRSCCAVAARPAP
jgi:predicted extracellular nuclease